MHVSIRQSDKYWSTHWGFVPYYNLPLFLEFINQAPTYDRQKFNHFSFKLPKIILTKNWKATRRFTTGTNFILRRYYTQKRMLIFSSRAQCFGRIRTKKPFIHKNLLVNSDDLSFLMAQYLMWKTQTVLTLIYHTSFDHSFVSIR